MKTINVIFLVLFVMTWTVILTVLSTINYMKKTEGLKLSDRLIHIYFESPDSHCSEKFILSGNGKVEVLTPEQYKLFQKGEWPQTLQVSNVGIGDPNKEYEHGFPEGVKQIPDTLYFSSDVCHPLGFSSNVQPPIKLKIK